MHGAEKLWLFMPILPFLLFTLVGNYMGNIRPNYFGGIKVPWNLNSDEVWTRTHKMAGKLWFWGGITGIAGTLFIKDTFFVLIPILLIIIVAPIVYSYFIYQQIEKK